MVIESRHNLRDYGSEKIPFDYACDLARLMNRFGFMTRDSIVAATYDMAKLSMHSLEIGNT